MTIKNNSLNNLWQWFRNQVQTVPSEMSACEFECQELECNDEKWEKCDKRKEVEALEMKL